MMRGSNKRPIMAWWLPPSFSRVQFTDIDMVLYAGTHVPRRKGTRDLPEVKNDPEAFLPKVDICIYSMYGPEAMPMYARDMATLIAGINLLCATGEGGGSTLTGKSNALLNMWMKGRNDLPLNPYMEFDPNKVEFKDIIHIAGKYGHPMVKYDIVDPMKRPKDIMWLKKAHVHMKRVKREKRGEFREDMVILGKDIKRNDIVIGMKKTFGNYSRIVPLYKGGLYFVTAFRFMSEVKPTRYPVITRTTLERMIEEKMSEMKDMDMAFFDLTMKMRDIKSLL